MPNCQKIVRNGHVNSVVKSCLQIVAIMCRLPQNKEFMMEHSMMFFIQVIIPALRVTEDEREMIESDPAEFCHLSLDACTEF